MKNLFLGLVKVVVVFLFISCSQNEEQAIDESINNSKIKIETSSTTLQNSNGDLTEFNKAVNEMCNLNNINNNVEFVEVLDNNLNPFLKLDLQENYNFQYTSSVSINLNGSYGGVLHVGTVDKNHIVIAHELPTGSLDDIIDIRVYLDKNNLWSSNVKSILDTNLLQRRMTRAECERQTSDLVMAGTAFTGLTSWWCPPCGFAGGIVTGMVAVGYFTCRL